MGHTWKSILEALDKKKQAPEEEKRQMLSFCADYALFADKEWQGKWDDCSAQVIAVLDLMNKGDFAKAREAADGVYQMIKACHKEYK